MKAEVSRSDEISPIILHIIIFIVRPFVPDSLVWGLAIAQLVVLIRAIPRRDWTTIHLAILLWSLTLFSVIPGTRRWPWVLLVPVLLYWALVQSFRPLRLTVGWLCMGHPTLPLWFAAGASGCHYLRGFNGGSVRRWLASAYGAVLDVLRVQSAGLLVPLVTHAVTDFSIFEILLYLAHG